MDHVGPDQLSRLLDEHGARLVLYAQQWCASPEDVVQEAFVALARQRPAPADGAAWLYRTVRNAAISAARKSRRRSLHESIAAQSGPLGLLRPTPAGSTRRQPRRRSRSYRSR